ncbi:TPA: polyphosphate kinase [Yersinia enterocolitica]
MLSKDKLKYPTEITDEQLRYLITAFENNMAEFYPVGREAEIARQLLSLREQLAELKALPPVGYVGNSDLYALSTGDLGCIAPYNAFEGIPLFTAAKPAEIPRHIYSMLVNELHDVPAIGCKRELIIGVLNRHGITAEPVQFDPPATE